MVLSFSYSEILIIQLHENLVLSLLPSSLFVDVLNLITPFQFLHLAPIFHPNLHLQYLHQKLLKSLHLNRLISFKKTDLSEIDSTTFFFINPRLPPITKLVISFPERTSQNPSVLSSDSHLLNFDLNTDQYSTPPTANRVDYPLIVNDTLVNSHHQDSRFLYLATNKLNSNTNFSNERRRKNFNVLTLQTWKTNLKSLLNSII